MEFFENLYLIFDVNVFRSTPFPRERHKYFSVNETRHSFTFNFLIIFSAKPKRIFYVQRACAKQLYFKKDILLMLPAAFVAI